MPRPVESPSVAVRKDLRRMRFLSQKYDAFAANICLAHCVRFGQTQTFALRTAFILAHAQGRCASVIRKRYRLFGYKPHFRVGAGSPSADRYRFARFGECGFYLKNTMHLLRIL